MILVTGATGLNGSELVQTLSTQGVLVRALVRDASKSQSLRALPHVEVVEGDMLRPETLDAALLDIDRAMLISSSTPTMVETQTRFIDAAKRAGVRHIVKLSGIIPELDSPFRFARMHAEIERYLEASGVAFTQLRAGEFMQAYFRQASRVTAAGVLALPMEDAKIASIDAHDIARVAATTLTTGGHEGKVYPITGPESLSMAEVAERLAAVIGKPVRYINITPEQATQSNLAAGIPPYLAEGLAELFSERRKGKEAQVSQVISEVFGWRPTSFVEFAQRNAAIFRGDQPAPKR
jgi:uncharacterized protein YbjT (DUF2867 family)